MFNKLLEQILKESVSMNDINDAIDNHHRVIINYHSKGEDIATGARVIEVYAYGLTKAGNPVIRAFEPYGDTRTRVPSWKFFRLDRISSWKPTQQKFSRPASFYYKGLGEFNPEGDNTMSSVYKIAKFDNDANMTINKNDKIKKDTPFKTDTEIRMERLKQQLDNPIKLNDLNTPNTTQYSQQKNASQIDNSKKDNDEITQLRNDLGDTSEPISMQDLNQRLSNNNIFKTDTEKRMEHLKQQLDNPKYIDLDKIPKR